MSATGKNGTKQRVRAAGAQPSSTIIATTYPTAIMKLRTLAKVILIGQPSPVFVRICRAF
jgi:hypothetical protein